MFNNKPPRYILMHVSKQHLKYKFSAANAESKRPRARGYKDGIYDKFCASLINKINRRGLKASVKIN